MKRDQGIIEGLQILCSVSEDYSIAAEHDVIYAGTYHNEYTPEQRARLRELDWRVDHTCNNIAKRGTCDDDNCPEVNNYSRWRRYV